MTAYGVRIVIGHVGADLIAMADSAEAARPLLQDQALGLAAALEDWVAGNGNFFEVAEASMLPRFSLAELIPKGDQP